MFPLSEILKFIGQIASGWAKQQPTKIVLFYVNGERGRGELKTDEKSN